MISQCYSGRAAVHTTIGGNILAELQACFPSEQVGTASCCTLEELQHSLAICVLIPSWSVMLSGVWTYSVML